MPAGARDCYVEPALKVTFADGNRDLVLHYDSHTMTANGFDVVLKDIKRNIFVTLHYSIDPESGILARSATIENREAQPVTVEQAAAAAWALPPAHYTLNYLTGRWAGEWTLTQEKLASGRAGDRKPARVDRAPGESVVCDSGRRAQRGSRRGVVRRAGLERLVAHHDRAGPVGRGARDRRLQSIRLRLRAASRPVAGDAGRSMAAMRRTGWARLRGCCTTLRLRTCCRIGSGRRQRRAEAAGR